VAIWAENNPDTFAKWRNGSTRFSSKAERALAEKLAMLGFVRNRVVRTDTLSFAVDMMSADGRVWVESDGEWHFRQVHARHDFEKTQLRDKIEEEEALKRGVLLLRVDNQKFSLDEQLTFVWEQICNWDGHSDARKLY
jgi:very-short-patch-repair endonuclease